MNESFIESRKAVSKAREALKKGAMSEARQWAERAAELTPNNEDPWLILAAVASPRESLDYIRKALRINPNSPRAKQGMEWAMQKLGETPPAPISPDAEKQDQVIAPNMAADNTPNRPKNQARPKDVKNPRKRNSILPILFVVTGCAVFAFAAWSAVTSPVLASILNIAATPQAQTKLPFAQVNIAKPDVIVAVEEQQIAQVAAPTATSTAVPEATATQEAQPEIASVLPTNTPTLEVSAALPQDTSVPPTATQPEATSEPGTILAQIVADTPTSEYIQPTVAPYVPPQIAGGNGEHWIDVNLSQQRVYAYAGDTLMNSFIVSTGTWQTPTVTGQYKIWIKVRSQAMTGPGYYLPDVPYVMYFYKDYGLHGTYWHNNFGTPMSHGCVNLSIPDAEWLYNFSSVGTPVNVHY
jgi:lipoprotein-anchoring transpeptidase ErfK/SrfK